MEILEALIASHEAPFEILGVKDNLWEIVIKRQQFIHPPDTHA
ncbi:MAG: hypothetical protein QNL68_06085 [Akkermansiaceae bacterium]